MKRSVVFCDLNLARLVLAMNLLTSAQRDAFLAKHVMKPLSMRQHESNLRQLSLLLESRGFTLCEFPTAVGDVIAMFETVRESNRYRMLLAFRQHAETRGMELCAHSDFRAYYAQSKSRYDCIAAHSALSREVPVNWDQIQERAAFTFRRLTPELEQCTAAGVLCNQQVWMEILLCLFVLELPPLRVSEYCSIQIADNGKNNYLDMETGVYVMRDYKSSKHFTRRYGTVERRVPLNRAGLDSVVVDGNVISRVEHIGDLLPYVDKRPGVSISAFLFAHALQWSQSAFLFRSGSGDHGYSVAGLTAAMMRLFGVNGQGLRVSFVSTFAPLKTAPTAVKHMAAYCMGHSLKMQCEHYNVLPK